MLTVPGGLAQFERELTRDLAIVRFAPAAFQL
jgi:hypothetical protein